MKEGLASTEIAQQQSVDVMIVMCVSAAFPKTSVKVLRMSSREKGNLSCNLPGECLSQNSRCPKPGVVTQCL